MLSTNFLFTVIVDNWQVATWDKWHQESIEKPHPSLQITYGCTERLTFLTSNSFKASRRPEQNVRKASGKHGSDSYWYFPALESDNVLIRNPYVPPCQTKERIRNKEHMYRSKTLKASQEQICNKKWQTSLLKCEAYWCPTNALLTLRLAYVMWQRKP